MRIRNILKEQPHDQTSRVQSAMLVLMVAGTPTIHPDGTVDMIGSIVVPNKLSRLPVKFGHVSVDFECGNEMTTLMGSPQSVGDSFACSHSNITSLVGGPRRVGNWYSCIDCAELTTLEGAPEYVGYGLELDDTPKLRAILPVLKIKGLRHLSHEASSIIMRHYKPDGTGDIIALQDDLIEAGWAHIARMK